MNDLPRESLVKSKTTSNDHPEYIISLEDFLKLKPFKGQLQINIQET
jgi:hypothetical protein